MTMICTPAIMVRELGQLPSGGMFLVKRSAHVPRLGEVWVHTS